MAKQALLVENISQQASGVCPVGPEHLEVRSLFIYLTALLMVLVHVLSIEAENGYSISGNIQCFLVNMIYHISRILSGASLYSYFCQ